MPDDLYVTLVDGKEVPADADGKPLLSEEEDNENTQTLGSTGPVGESDSPSTQPVEPSLLEDLPKEIADENFVLITDTGWIAFKPDHVQEEGQVLILLLDDKATNFIPKMGSRFMSRWKKVDGTFFTEQLYFAGFRFKLPQIAGKTVLGFVKVS